MPEAVIVAAARTPIARAGKGSLVDVDALELARIALGATLERSGVPAAEIDDVVVAESGQGGGVIARHAALLLGMTDVPGLSDNRHCAAGLSAIQIAAGSIKAGMDRAVLAGGTHSSTNAPRSLRSIPVSANDWKPWMSESHPFQEHAPQFDMSITVGENTARICGITREEADFWSYHSNQRAAYSRDNGLFDEEIIPVTVSDGNGGTRVFDKDEHPRPETTLERFAQLAVLHPELPNAVVTAGNSSGINDASAAVLVVSDEFAAAHGLTPLARIVSWASAGVDPERTGLGPVAAIPKALERGKMATTDVDLWEINEAFATMAVASSRILGLDHDIVNVNGSGVGLGHPIACTGARMVVTMLHELRRRGGTLGGISMCAGGGMGSALILELL